MIRGEAHLVFRDVNTGEITKERTQSNVITNSMFSRLCDANLDYANGYGRFGDNVMIGGNEQPSDRSNTRIYDVYAFGYNEAGVTSPRYLSGNVGTGNTFAYYYEWQQRFNPPSFDRDIHVVGVNWDGGTLQRDNYHRPTDAAAYLQLTTPCVQTTTETLDVFYRVIWDNPDPVASGIDQARANQIASRHAPAGGSSAIYYPNYNIFYHHLSKAMPFVGDQYLGDCYHGIGSSGLGGIFGGTTYAGGTANGITSYKVREMYFTCSLTQLVGRVVGGVGHLRNDTTEESWTKFYNPLLRPDDSPIQNMFGHNAAATGPFYSSTTVPAGGGTCELNGDAWTNPDWNKLFHIEITGSGNVGVATYKLHTHNLTGFRNNTYQPSAVGIPLCNANATFDGHTWFQDGSTYYSDYNGLLAMEYGTHSTRMVVFKYDTFGWMDLMTQEHYRFHATSTPAFDGVDISQICVVPDRSNIGSLVANEMWVADAGTGLYRVSADGSTITKFDTTHVNLAGLAGNECYGVTYTPGRIWAAFNGGLVFTDDNGTTFNVYDGTSTPIFTVADFSRIWFIQGDPAHADHRLAIAYNTEATPTNRADFDIYWWDSVAGHGNTRTNMYYGGTGADPRRRCETFRLFSCSPDDGVWGCRAYNASSDQVAMFNYNATAHTHVYATHGTWDERHGYFLNWTKDLSGADAIHVTYYSNDNFRFGLCKQDGTRVLSDRYYRTTNKPLGSYTNWCADGSGAQSQKCITAGGMFVAGTLRNNTAGGMMGWYMQPAWADNDAPLGGEGYHILWKGYGWDGANWVEGNTNSKTTHAAHEALIDGVTVAFDDDTGAEQFFATDHYTCGVVDGVLVDAATEISHTYGLYYKPTDFDVTDIENAGILPAATDEVRYYEPEATRAGGHLIDNSGVSVSGGGDYLASSSDNWRCRLNHLMDDYANFRWRIDTGTSFSTSNFMTVGFCDSSKIGTTVSASNIDFAFQLRRGALGGNTFAVDVISNGTVITTVDIGDYPGFGNDTGDGRLNRNNEDYIYFRLRRDPGTTDLQMIYREKVVHTFTGVTNVLVPAIKADGGNSQHYDIRVDTIGYTLTDYMASMGDSGSGSGVFDPNFFCIDYTAVGQPRPDTIKINGVPATTVLVNDYITPLATGEIDVLAFRGKIRFSAADIGKTLTIDRYNVILHE